MYLLLLENAICTFLKPFYIGHLTMQMFLQSKNSMSAHLVMGTAGSATRQRKDFLGDGLRDFTANGNSSPPWNWVWQPDPNLEYGTLVVMSPGNWLSWTFGRSGPLSKCSNAP